MTGVCRPPALSVLLGVVCVVFALAVSSMSAIASSDATKESCVKPTPGSYVGSCQALGPKPGNTPTHALDRWIACEIDSGVHGTVGYGVAIFLSEQAVAAWNEELASYVSRLENSLGPKEAKRLLDEQKRWEKSRPRQEEEITRKYAKGAGTLIMVYWAADTAAIPRKRALVLGCRLERIGGAEGSD